MRFSSGSRFTAAAIGAAGLLAAGACGGADDEASSGPEVEPGADAVAEAERLYQILSDNRAVEDELIAIEHRVAKRCMEDEGFSVHDPMVFLETDYASYGAAGYLTDAPVRAIPTPEAAERWGFGVWVEFVRNPGNEQYAEELLTPEVRTAFNLGGEDHGMPDTSEWDAESDDYRAAWIEAYTGSPALRGSVKGPERDPEAPPGGCWLAMVATIYGEPYVQESEGDDGEEGGAYEVAHEPSPMFAVEEFEDHGELVAQVDAEVVAFETCLIDAGYEGWELGDQFYPPLWEYFGGMYDPAYFEAHGEEGMEVPDLPETVPGDFMGVLELERAMATDFAACGQESGLRAAVEEAWAALLVEAYAPLETEIVAWQERMQGHLDNAQDYLRE